MIDVERRSSEPDGWIFSVRVSDELGSTTHRVTLARIDWQRLAGQVLEPEPLVQGTFEFLLEHERDVPRAEAPGVYALAS